MNGIIACEESQIVAKAFLSRGHFFISNDLKPCSGNRPDRHFKGECFDCIDRFEEPLDFLGFHPECTFLTNAGIGWLVRKKPTKGFEWSEKYQRYINLDRLYKMEEACIFFLMAYERVKKVGRGYLENPIMHPYAMEMIGIKPTQIIQPWMFGHMEQKATCLWLIGLPPLEETNNVYDEMMKLSHAERNRIHYLSPSKDRAELRSKTLPGIAKAMAKQWG